MGFRNVVLFIQWKLDVYQMLTPAFAQGKILPLSIAHRANDHCIFICQVTDCSSSGNVSTRDEVTSSTM